jgi:hypothetical protein
MLSKAEYQRRGATGSDGWDGLWVSWKSLADAKKRATDPLSILAHGNNRQ